MAVMVVNVTLACPACHRMTAHLILSDARLTCTRRQPSSETGLLLVPLIVVIILVRYEEELSQLNTIKSSDHIFMTSTEKRCTVLCFLA